MSAGSLKEPVELAGYQLPAGVMVVPGIGLVHSSSRRTRIRTGSTPTGWSARTWSPTTWLPFGGGNRRCLGATFAMVEMRVVLREVLRRVELCTTTAAGERQRVKHVILVPHRGARIRVRAFANVPAAAPAPRTRRRVCIVRERTRGHRCHRDRGSDGTGAGPKRSLDRRPATRTRRRACAHHDLRRPAGRHRGALRFLADERVDLIVTSGGLGPTADDMTVQVVAQFCGRELVLDDELEEKIAEILKRLRARFTDVDFDAVRAANRKQAMVPAGATILDPVGTAPGVVVQGKPTVLVLPGPPRELQPMWHTAVKTPALQEAIAGRTNYRQGTVRMFGLPESGLAETLREAEGSITGFERLEITTCLRRGEVEMVTRYEPDEAAVYAELMGRLARTPCAADLFGGRRPGRRSGGAAADGPPYRDGGVLHRGPRRRTAHRPAWFVRVRRRRRGGLRQRGEVRHARCRRGAHRNARGGVRTGRRSDGRAARCAASTQTPRSRPPESPGLAAAPRTSRSARCASP